MAKTNDLPAGTRVLANYVKKGGIYPGVIIDNLSVMYYIKFDIGGSDFVFKAENVKLEG